MGITPEFFFDLASFKHPTLFRLNEPVWVAISDLPFYLGALIANRASRPYRSAHETMDLHPSVVIERPDQVVIAPDAVIKPHTVIEGPAVIESGAIIGPHAYLRGGALIGAHARVGCGSEVKRSILFPYAKAPHKNTVLDSILGYGVNLGGHLVTPNVRRSGKSIKLSTQDGRLIETQMSKLGIIAGDNCFFGCAVHFNPGDCFLPGTRLID